MKKIPGFTLVEVVVVIAFTVIIMTIGVVNLLGSRSKYALETAAEKIVFDLRLASENAKGQKDGTAWGIRMMNDVTGGYFEVFSGDDYASGIKIPRTVLSSEVQFVVPASGAALDIVFNKVTGLPATSASITIGLRNFPTVTKTITVNANGTITY